MQRMARVAGWCYLSVIAGGLFAEAVRGAITAPDDAAATVRNIAAHGALWRWGLLVHLLYLVPALAVNVLVPELFRPAQAVLARVALVFGVVAVSIEAMGLLLVYAPLTMLDDPPAAYRSASLFDPAFGLSLAMFAVFCGLVGALILRSGLVPRPIGVLMVLAGACYLLNTAALIVSPELHKVIFPAVLAPCLAGEAALALYLVIRGGRESPS
jgi:hypothetical protein